MANDIVQSPNSSLPHLFPDWHQLKAAYRFLSNPRVDPHAIAQPHRLLTLEACADHPVVLCVQDTTELDLTTRTKMRGRGRLGGGTTRGLLQHSTLAVVPDAHLDNDDVPLDALRGRLLGLLDQQWNRRTEPTEGETLRQVQGRRTDADVWSEAADSVAQLGATPARLIHVGDRHCDVFRFFDHVRSLGHGFVIRARFDRELQGEMARLWPTLEAEPIAGHVALTIHGQRDKRGTTRVIKRDARLAVRYKKVRLCPPTNDPRTAKAEAVELWAVSICEVDAPENAEAVSWMLLSSEPVNDLTTARRVIVYYRHRWLIEEWHRALKEGCRVEDAGFDDVEDVKRLAAIKGVAAVRLMLLRDLAEQSDDDPAALQQVVPWLWIQVVAKVSKVNPQALTAKKFWLAIAQQGGYPARKRDPRPGWKVIWRGWYDIRRMVDGAELFIDPPPPDRCG